MPKKVVYVALVVVAAMMASCATAYTPEKAYLGAREQFNLEVERYLTRFDAASEEDRAIYREEIDPYIFQAGEALEVWGLAIRLKNGDGSEMDQYLDAKDSMIDALVKIYGEE